MDVKQFSEGFVVLIVAVVGLFSVYNQESVVGLQIDENLFSGLQTRTEFNIKSPCAACNAAARNLEDANLAAQRAPLKEMKNAEARQARAMKAFAQCGYTCPAKTSGPAERPKQSPD